MLILLLIIIIIYKNYFVLRHSFFRQFILLENNGILYKISFIGLYCHTILFSSIYKIHASRWTANWVFQINLTLYFKIFTTIWYNQSTIKQHLRLLVDETMTSWYKYHKKLNIKNGKTDLRHKIENIYVYVRQQEHATVVG